MERRLAAAAEAGAPVLIVRAGDFFGPRAAEQLVLAGPRQARPAGGGDHHPGARGVGHQWGYLPDVAETMARLAERPAGGVRELPHGRPLGPGRHGDGRRDPPRRSATPACRCGRFPWRLVRLAAPFVPLFRELVEMRALWEQPIRMANDRLVAAIGPEPHTPLDAGGAGDAGGARALPPAAALAA